MTWVCVDPKTGEIDHDWQYLSDWEGDPGVIDGTRTTYCRVCRECGFGEPCGVDMFDDDEDYYDR